MTTAALWFNDEAKFRQLCGDAVSRANTDRSAEFAGQMVQKAKQYGLETRLSDKQLTWLCSIAGVMKPAQFAGGRR